MLVAALLCFVLAVLLLRARKPPETPNSSRLYRIDNRVAASALFVLAITFALLAWRSGTLLF